MLDKKMVNLFFKTARERELIRLRRANGGDGPWSTDEVLSNFRFCNVRREDDRTTVWFRENLRDPLKMDFDAVILATVAFRIFNLMASGERLMPLLSKGKWETRRALKMMKGQKPIVTGAHMVHTPWGMDKLHGCCKMVEIFLHSNARGKLVNATSLAEAHAILLEVPYLGPFLSYEIVSDLRWTCVLDQADDIMTWANPGPGCMRGLSHLTGEPVDKGKKARQGYIDLMRVLLRRSKARTNWRQDWQPWEMREVEHWLCEFSKYINATEGKKLKRRYSHD